MLWSGAKPTSAVTRARAAPRESGALPACRTCIGRGILCLDDGSIVCHDCGGRGWLHPAAPHSDTDNYPNI